MLVDCTALAGWWFWIALVGNEVIISPRFLLVLGFMYNSECAVLDKQDNRPVARLIFNHTDILFWTHSLTLSSFPRHWFCLPALPHMHTQTHTRSCLSSTGKTNTHLLSIELMYDAGCTRPSWQIACQPKTPLHWLTGKVQTSSQQAYITSSRHFPPLSRLGSNKLLSQILQLDDASWLSIKDKNSVP